VVKVTGDWGLEMDIQGFGEEADASSPEITASLVDDQPIASPKNFQSNSDPFQKGWEYLNQMRQLTPEPGMIELSDDISDRIRICTWIGDHIDEINLELRDCLEICHQCFPVTERQKIKIFAAPLASRFGIDGLCNILLDPIVIFIDVGRVGSQDWLSLVVHEYAHAHLKSPGHDRRFLGVLTHLCLGIGFAPPLCDSEMDREAIAALLRNWPHCTPTPDPLAFWQGQ
jgi:hypothetical protein